MSKLELAENLIQANQALQQEAERYVSFSVAGKVVPIPYYLSKNRWQFWRTSGKGTVDEINKELTTVAQQHSFNLEQATNHEIYSFMKKNNIGIDCSGLAYHLLNRYLQTLSNQSLSNVLNRYPGALGTIEKNVLQFKRPRRINVKTLTSDLNSIPIASLNKICIGDMIKLITDLDHILVVTNLTYVNEKLQSITYVHSSAKHTQKQGPHYGIIKVVDLGQGLEAQEWQEKTKDGKNYGKEFFKPERGDGVRRMKLINQFTITNDQ